MRILIKNIRFLIGAEAESPVWRAGAEMDALPVLENAWLAVEDGLVADYGSMDEMPGIVDWRELEIIDADGRALLPGWCDAHTHTVFAGWREGEFEDRIRGAGYEEIAARGGGILNSARRLRTANEEELYNAAYQRLDEMAALGTVAVEIKSGYGLTLESELKMLRVIRRLKETHAVMVKSTFLAAHAIPEEFKSRKDEYVNDIITHWIPRVASEGLADFVDVFCERGYFDLSDTERILEAGVKYGLKGKPHVNQFSSMGGVGAGVRAGAISIDHLEQLEDMDIAALHGSRTMPVALPGCSFFLGIPYTPARSIIDAGLPLALSSDFNPGSAPSFNMNFILALACIRMKMTPREAICAATVNSAYAMEVSQSLGSLAIGKLASFILTRPIESPASLAYRFGSDLIDRVYIEGMAVR